MKLITGATILILAVTAIFLGLSVDHHNKSIAAIELSRIEADTLLSRRITELSNELNGVRAELAELKRTADKRARPKVSKVEDSSVAAIVPAQVGGVPFPYGDTIEGVLGSYGPAKIEMGKTVDITDEIREIKETCARLVETTEAHTVMLRELREALKPAGTEVVK